MTQSPSLAPQHPEVILIGSYLVALVMDVDRIPLSGETLLARNFREAYGGKGSDMAVQAARLGTAVRFVGCIGDDDFGRAFLSLMQHEGVTTDLVQVRPELKTGAGFIIKSSAGQNIITVDIGANQLFAPADVDLVQPFLHRSSVMLIQLEIPLSTAFHAACRGQEHRCTVILNPAPACDLRGHDLSMIDILTPNETEARVCLGLDPADPTEDAVIGMRLRELGCRAVIITLGARGCLVVTADGVTSVPAYEVPKIVDSNGAGDSFNAALATALLDGKPLLAAAQFANAVAGLSCSRWDTVPSYHTRAEVDQFLHAVAHPLVRAVPE